MDDISEYKAKEIAEEVQYRYTGALDRFSKMRTRQIQIRALVEARWQSVFPNELEDGELPMVANTFRKHTEDIGHLFGQSAPTERCFTSGHNDEKQTEKRERIMISYNERSHFNDILEYFGMDITAAAYAAIRTWPEKGMRGAARFPVHERLDPLNVLPEVDWNPGKPTDNVCVHFTETLERLQKQFPEQSQALLKEMADKNIDARSMDYNISSMADQIRHRTLTMVDWYSRRYVARVAVARGENKTVSQLLFYKDNETDICPVQMAYRPSWGAEPIGQLDDSKGIFQGKNRAWRLLLDYFIQMVYGGKLSWNVRNPQDKGPNTTYWALGPDAFMKPVTPEQSSFQALQMVGQMDNEGRIGSVNPSSREGEAPLNKATAAFLSRSQGELNDVVRSFYKNFDAAKRNANEAAFAQDEAWCGGEGKKISGIARGKRFADTYTPAKDINGDFSNSVSHGPASGLDLPTHMVMNQNKLGLGAMSLEAFIEQDPTVEEVTLELERIRREKLEAGWLDGLNTQGTLDARSAAIQAMLRGEPLDDIIEKARLAEKAAQAALPPTVPQPGGGAPGPAGGGAPSPTGPPGLPGAEGPSVPLPPPALLRAGGR